MRKLLGKLYKMNKQQLLEHLTQDVYCRLGVSKIQGIGVIAIRDIPKGTDPFVKAFRTHVRGNSIGFSSGELAHLSSAIKKMISDFFAQEEGKIYIPSCGLNRMDISFFLNHSDTPNVLEDTENGGFFAARNIAIGEELTIDYVTYAHEDVAELQKDKKLVHAFKGNIK